MPENLQTDLIDWYWQHGHKREGRFELPRGSWLDQLYSAKTVLEAAEASSRRFKPSLGVWGPSQTGKSTLISTSVDAGSDACGEGSALHWPKGKPARFVPKDPTTEATILNPFNFGSDASGCVSRFVLRSDADIADPMHPVELRLANPMQLRHALAMGYLSECRIEDAKYPNS